MHHLIRTNIRTNCPVLFDKIQRLQESIYSTYQEPPLQTLPSTPMIPMDWKPSKSRIQESERLCSNNVSESHATLMCSRNDRAVTAP